MQWNVECSYYILQGTCTLYNVQFTVHYLLASRSIFTSIAELLAKPIHDPCKYTIEHDYYQ